MYCHLFAATGMEVIILRLANVYGPRDRDRVITLFAEQALAGKPLTVFGNNKILDFLWIEDLISVLYQAAHCPCPQTPVNVGSGRGINLLDLAQRISQLTGSASAVHVSPERQPEVGRFVADVTAARKIFDLHCPEDPIEHAPAIIEFVRCGMLTQTAAVEGGRP
jgi:UDP-glucose 4-epimerase